MQISVRTASPVDGPVQLPAEWPRIEVVEDLVVHGRVARLEEPAPVVVLVREYRQLTGVAASTMGTAAGRRMMPAVDGSTPGSAPLGLDEAGLEQRLEVV